MLKPFKMLLFSVEYLKRVENNRRASQAWLRKCRYSRSEQSRQSQVSVNSNCHVQLFCPTFQTPTTQTHCNKRWRQFCMDPTLRLVSSPSGRRFSFLSKERRLLCQIQSRIRALRPTACRIT